MITIAGERPIILVFPFGLLAHYLRCLQLCRHFRESFDVRIAYHADFRSFIRKEDLQTFDCLSIDARLAVKSVNKFDFKWINEQALDRVYRDQVRVIDELKPVAVLGDYSLTLKMAAQATGVSFISLMNGYTSKYYSGFRKISKTHPAFSFLNWMPTALQVVLTKTGEEAAFKQLHKPFKSLRKKYGLRLSSGYQEELEGDINLICDLESIFPQKTLPPSYHLITPLFYEGSSGRSAVPIRLDPTRKTILAAMGSSGTWENLSFLNDPYFQKFNVVAAGDEQKILRAQHIMHFDFIDISSLVPYPDLVLCHGGNGTIYQALSYGIPVLCKTSHCEQEWNIHAFEQRKLGKNLDGLNRPEDYKKAIEEWISRKGSPEFEACSSQIKQKKAQLPGIIRQISDSLLRCDPGTISNQQLVLA